MNTTLTTNGNGHAPVDLHKGRRRGLPRVEPPSVPPHSPEAEAGALACVLMAGNEGAQQEVGALLSQLKPSLFYVHVNRTLHDAMALMHSQGHAVDAVCLVSWLKSQKLLEQAGGLEYVARLPEQSPSIFNFQAYAEILREKLHARWRIDKGFKLIGTGADERWTIGDTKELLSDLLDATNRVSKQRPKLKIWRAKELESFTPDPKLRLVGDNELTMGYDGIAVIAGPGSSGKSLCASSLALAGAIGHGEWMGRTVHRKFKTLFIQAENGAVRLKSEVEAMRRAHPKVDIDGHIFVSDPPEGGLPFHHTDFRRAVRDAVEELKPSVVILDPWSQVAAEDAAKEVVDKLGEIRSCFPTGDECPCTLIIAHTKKPRTEDVRRGRGLTNLVSGSVALPNTARTVYVLLPWSDDLTDDRILWTCAKLNNGQMYSPSVWHRRFGTFFENDAQTDPSTWGVEEAAREERRAITHEMLVSVFTKSKRPGMKRAELADALHKQFGIGQSTTYRAIKEYAGEWLTEAAGVVALKKGVTV